MSNDDNGWGATFHRHTMSNEIHRDGGSECTSKQSPREVYVFDPDFLREHDAAVWDAGHVAGEEAATGAPQDNPYRADA